MQQFVLRNLSWITQRSSKTLVIYACMYALAVEGKTLEETVRNDLKKCHEKHGPNLIRSIFLPDGTAPRECNISETIYPNAYKDLDKRYADKIIVTDKDFRGALGVPINKEIDHSVAGKQISVNVKTEQHEKNSHPILASPIKGYTQLPTQ